MFELIIEIFIQYSSSISYSIALVTSTGLISEKSIKIFFWILFKPLGRPENSDKYLFYSVNPNKLLLTELLRTDWFNPETLLFRDVWNKLTFFRPINFCFWSSMLILILISFTKAAKVFILMYPSSTVHLLMIFLIKLNVLRRLNGDSVSIDLFWSLLFSPAFKNFPKINV
jgi:hypothetical protein